MTEDVQTSQMTPRQKRRIVLISGWIVLAFSLYLLAFLVPDVIKNAVGPDSMSLARAAETASSDSTFAKIEDGEWHCDTITYVRGPSSSNRLNIITHYTEAFLTDSEGRIVLFATFSGEKDCAAIESGKLDGYLTRMSSSTQRELTDEVRLAQFVEATAYLEMCVYCGPSNSLIGVVFGGLFGMGGVALLAFGYRMSTEASASVGDDMAAGANQADSA